MAEQTNIEEIMRLYGDDVLRMCYSYVKDMHTAEDLFQETFIKVYKSLSTFQGESSIKTWILRIAINTCKDYLKSAYSRHVVPMEEFMEDAIVSDSDFDGIEREETSKEVKDAIMELPEKYREVVMCVYYQEMSMAECGAALGLSEGTVKSRLSRAKDRLKVLLERRL